MWGHHILCSSSTLSYWQAQSKFSDSVVTAATGAGGCSRVTLNFSRTTPTGTREDFASFTLHMAIVSWLANAVPLTGAQKADAEADLDTWAAVWAADASNQFTLVNYTWHDVTFGDKFYGPADRVTQKNVPGLVTVQRMPDQISPNVTFRTCSRRHWGRFYLPGIKSSAYDTTFGRPVNSFVDGHAAAVRTLGNNLLANTAATELAVYSHQYQALLEVSEINMDNVPDVVRRRRAKMPSYRKSFTS